MESEVVYFGQIILALAALSFMLFAVVELLFKSIVKRFTGKDAEAYTVVVQLLTACLGVLMAYFYQLDLIVAAMRIFDVNVAYGMGAKIMGFILTGVLLGRGSNWFHDLGDLLTPQVKKVS